MFFLCRTILLDAIALCFIDLSSGYIVSVLVGLRFTLLVPWASYNGVNVFERIIRVAVSVQTMVIGTTTKAALR